MADDLSQFFAKKAAKSKDKKKKVKVSVEDVGQVLERKAKRQEEKDRENEEEEKRAQSDATFFEKRAEDSEWLEFKDTNKEIIFEDLAIRDMNLTEQVEEAREEELKTAPVEAPKTWSTAEVKETEEQQTTIAPQKVGIYHAPRHRNPAPMMKGGAAPNLNDEDMFPSFAAAEKIEKLNKDSEKRKKNDGFTQVNSESRSTNVTASSGGGVWQRAGGNMSSSGSSAAADRAALFSAVKQVTTSGAPNPTPPAAPLLQKNPNAYVPPSRRRQE